MRQNDGRETYFILEENLFLYNSLYSSYNIIYKHI